MVGLQVVFFVCLSKGDTVSVVIAYFMVCIYLMLQLYSFFDKEWSRGGHR